MNKLILLFGLLAVAFGGPVPAIRSPQKHQQHDEKETIGFIEVNNELQENDDQLFGNEEEFLEDFEEVPLYEEFSEEIDEDIDNDNVQHDEYEHNLKEKQEVVNKEEGGKENSYIPFNYDEDQTGYDFWMLHEYENNYYSIYDDDVNNKRIEQPEVVEYEVYEEELDNDNEDRASFDEDEMLRSKYQKEQENEETKELNEKENANSDENKNKISEEQVPFENNDDDYQFRNEWVNAWLDYEHEKYEDNNNINEDTPVDYFENDETKDDIESSENDENIDYFDEHDDQIENYFNDNETDDDENTNEGDKTETGNMMEQLTKNENEIATDKQIYEEYLIPEFYENEDDLENFEGENKDHENNFDDIEYDNKHVQETDVSNRETATESQQEKEIKNPSKQDKIRSHEERQYIVNKKLGSYNVKKGVGDVDGGSWSNMKDKIQDSRGLAASNWGSYVGKIENQSNKNEEIWKKKNLFQAHGRVFS